jgi:hypothetical protein
MAKSKSKSKKKTEPKRPASPIRKTAKPSQAPSDFGHKFVRMTAGLLLVAVIVGGGYLLGKFMEQRVSARREEVPIPYQIEFLDTPAWIPDCTQREISRSVVEPFYGKVRYQNETLCRDIARKVAKNPWVLRVHRVWRERVGIKGRVCVKAEYRCPLVKVIRGTQEIYVADDGMVLPSLQVPKWTAQVAGSLRYYLHPSEVPMGFTRLQNFFITIQGVQTSPPQPGQKWLAEDLHAGIRLAKLLYSRRYYRQFSLIDTSNYAQRIDANGAMLVFYAQEGRTRATKILFGRFPHPDGGDYVIPPEKKMAGLDGIAGMFDGQIAGTYQQIDLRHYPPRKKDQ